LQTEAVEIKNKVVCPELGATSKSIRGVEIRLHTFFASASEDESLESSPGRFYA